MTRFAVALLLFLASCVGREARPPTAELPSPSPAFQTCHEACESLRARHCDAGQPTEDGAPCEVVCADTEGFHAGLFLQSAAEPSCVVNR